MHFGVNYFFVLSGFIMALVHWKDLGVSGRVVNFAIRRFFRIYPALWAAIALSLVLQIATGSYTFSLLDLFLAFTSLPVPVREAFLAVEWTLRHEILFYALFALAVWKPRFGLPAIGLWTLGSLVAGSAHDRWYSVLFSSYNVLFAMGMAGALAFRFNWITMKSTASLFALGAFIFGASWYLELHAGLWPHNVGLVLAYGLGSAIMISAAIEAERRGRLKLGHTLSFIGDASYSIYLVHFLVVSAGAKIATAMFARHGVVAAIAFLTVVILSVGCGIAFYLIVERGLLRSLVSFLSRKASRA